MTKFFFSLIFLNAHISFAQLSKPTTTKLSDIFKSSVHQKDKRKIDTDSNPWLICNKGNSFFTSDTLYLYDNINYYYQPENCCDFVGWTFYKANAFIQKEIQICNEPPTAKVTNDSDFYSINIEEKNNQSILKVYRKKQLVDTYTAIDFRIVSLSQKNQESNRLTLVRQK